jgi:hypothetical protein
MLKTGALAILFTILFTTTVSTQTPTPADLAWLSGAWQTEPGELFIAKARTIR